jgi:glutamate 5-kinase
MMIKNDIIVLKIGSNILATENGKLDLNNLRSFVSQVSRAIGKFNQQFVIVSSGSITCGAEQLDLVPVTIPDKQAAAAVGQILLMKEYAQFFGQHGITIAQLLLTQDGLEDTERQLNVKNTIGALMKQHIVPIVNENDSVATDEIKFGDNDVLSCKVAKLMGAKKLIILTDTEGLFSSNPKHNADATLIENIEGITDEHFDLVEDSKNHRSRGGMKSKLMSAKEATDSGIGVHIVSGRRTDVINDLLEGKSVGTFIKGRN